ncbi:VPA1269 family protein [Oleiharenicola sp. Vm1]|uniref:gamma-mobile-trio integrase GmtZ n=1 Tax=Oleiharenicola sp. Vm1 TaxID=3398393 RepID=UPI0039F5E2D4
MNKKPKKDPYHFTTDATFSWCQRLYGAKSADWQTLADAYMREVAAAPNGSYGPRIHTIAMWIRGYIAANSLWNPKELLARSSNPKPIFLQGRHAGVLFQPKPAGISANNRVCDFIDWVLKHDPEGRFGEWDDGDFEPHSQFRNPFPRASHTGVPKVAESEKQPLPWKFICRLKGKLAPGPNFSDWQWAINATGEQKGGTQSGDWFEVYDPKIASMMDLRPGDPGYDPDLVLRKVTVAVKSRKGYAVEKWNPKTKSAEPVLREVIQAWSPARAVAILTKLEICARTFQVRMLDSGEADEMRIELVDPTITHPKDIRFKWAPNPNRKVLLARLERADRRRVSRSQGAFRTFSSPYEDNELTGIFFNTNKTGDIGKDASEFGYFVPWQHSVLLRWLIKLRNWQERYNPIKCPTLWRDAEPRHIGQVLSPAKQNMLPPTCFLFRDASALNRPSGKVSPSKWSEKDHSMPIAKRSLDSLWGKLLFDFTKDLAESGETVGGAPINLIKRVSERSNDVTTKHPLHSIRVSLLSALAFEGNVPITILMKLAGHSSIIMTLLYTKLNAALLNHEMDRAIKCLNEDKEQNYVRWLAQQKVEDLTKSLVLLDPDSARSVLHDNPRDRSAHTWTRVHDGWCLAGGNTLPRSGNRQVPGCYNGGLRLPVSGGKSNDIRESVPPRRCAEHRCRWLCTGPAFLDELRAKFSTKGVLLADLERIRDDTEKKLNATKDERYDAERAGRPFDSSELERIESLLEKQETDVFRVSQEMTNVFYVVGRCLEVLRTTDGPDHREKLIALGTITDIKATIEQVDSELLAASGVCLDAELYPELESDATSAIYRRSQLLDMVRLRERGQVPLLVFDRRLQLEVGNRITEQIIRAQEAELRAANRAVPQGKLEILRIALDQVESSIQQRQELPLFLKDALRAESVPTHNKTAKAITT